MLLQHPIKAGRKVCPGILGLGNHETMLGFEAASVRIMLGPTPGATDGGCSLAANPSDEFLRAGRSAREQRRVWGGDPDAALHAGLGRHENAKPGVILRMGERLTSPWAAYKSEDVAQDGQAVPFETSWMETL